MKITGITALNRFFKAMSLLTSLLLCLFFPALLLAQELPQAHYSAFEAGNPPILVDGTYLLLDSKRTPGQSNTVAFDLAQQGAFERLRLDFQLRVLEGGEGGAFVFLNTAEYGKRGPAPYIKNWSEPNLKGSFAVGIDVHNPPSDERFGPQGNYQGFPERELSLHWDGREVVKRLVPVEFRSKFTGWEIALQHVVGGAEVSVLVAGQPVFERYFIPGMQPYEARLAIGAGSRESTVTEFAVRDIQFSKNEPARPRRPAKRFELFNHVQVNRSVPSQQSIVSLPPREWAYGRIILTLENHDAGTKWDKWDRTGHLYIINSNGERYDIAPFITPFLTPGRWQVDVSHFRPWLAGETGFEIAVNTDPDADRGFMLSASLEFYHGVPELMPYQIIPLWHGIAQYKSTENHFSDFFLPRNLKIDQEARAARLFITTSGHSEIGEFTPSRRTLAFVADRENPATEMRFSNSLWKTDNYLNPVRPQAGTWKYARAGWAPGDVVHPWEIDLTPYMIPGKTAELRYLPEPYDFSERPVDQHPTDDEINQAVQLVRSYLILYRSPENLIPAPAIEVLEVEVGSNAETGGIEAGDYLESYDGQRPETIDELLEMIKVAKAAGKERILVEIYRGTSRLNLELDPGRMGVKIAEELRH
ncbi:MAG: peptide-N-glycosidase F-related protein [Desulfuromusa sp.]|nr:peptide-N-glycosidase F-related protein [Desulfuromusa sp.]